MAYSRTVAIMSYLYEYEDAVNVDVHCLYLFPDITFVKSSSSRLYATHPDVNDNSGLPHLSATIRR